MASEISQTANKDKNDLVTRKWGQEFILYNEENPGAVWVSINQSDLIELDSVR